MTLSAYSVSFVLIVIDFVIGRISNQPVHGQKLHGNNDQYFLYLYVLVFSALTFSSGKGSFKSLLSRLVFIQYSLTDNLLGVLATTHTTLRTT